MAEKKTLSQVYEGKPVSEETARVTLRAPTQPRGQARVDAILDAAAGIIAEKGMARLTMHGIARQASTSIGSLYHFFPDQAGVLEALVARHNARIEQIKTELDAIPANIWRDLSVDEAIERLISPYLEYARQHPDFFPLMHGKRTPDEEAGFIEGVGRMLAARMPELSSSALERHAAMLHAMAAGTLHVAYILEPEQLAFYMREVPRALTAYLADIERETHG
ncbi:TetR/AcrR family transcriptional regulator [Altericroceibacterium spongiae]|uniref:TetR/AcrR family transcriptional regulator n=2 Tax=Altericroceibacterium spongiae TaxID=2320269 RepID=A0A420EAG0_9SPHN|nr:TetR/AcrR family transcriptional regulator [Altericroceibacterium spongiae]